MTDKDKFTRYFYIHKHYSDQKVESVEVKLSSESLKHGKVYITDMQLQEGDQPTGTTPNTREFFNKKYFSIDETHNATSYENIYLGDEPIVFEHMENRFFNIIGRGFETITIPNAYHEDYTVPILTTGLDLTLYPKNDYDFLRIATFYGDKVESDQDKTYKSSELNDNPLNTRYTKEFCFKGGKSGDKIELKSSKQHASVNGKHVRLGVQRFKVGEDVVFGELQPVYYHNRQRFMALPVGATRITIQFMKKQVKDGLEFMIDDGIGFQGLAKFDQWTWGVSKI